MNLIKYINIKAVISELRSSVHTVFSGRFSWIPYQTNGAPCWRQVFTHRCLSAGYSPSKKHKEQEWCNLNVF